MPNNLRDFPGGWFWGLLAGSARAFFSLAGCSALLRLTYTGGCFANRDRALISGVQVLRRDDKCRLGPHES